MKKRLFGLKNIVILSAVLATLLFGLVKPIQAQSTDNSRENITLSPAITKPEVKAGSINRGSLTVINDGETDYRFIVYSRPYSVTSERYDPSYTVINERTEAYQWVQFESTNLQLSAGGRVEIPYTLTVPDKAKSGGHYVVLFAETQPKQAEGTQVTRKKRVGSLMYITVNGELIKSGSIVDWDAKFWQKNKPIAASFRIKNDGNIHFQANSKITFSNIFNKPRLQLYQEQFVIPGTTRKIVANTEKTPAIGVYRVSGTASFLGRTEVLESKWIILFPLQVVNAFIAIIALLIAWRLVKPFINSRGSKKNAAARRDKK